MVNRKFNLEELTNFFHSINPNKSQSTYNTMKYNLMRIAKVANIDFIDIDSTTLNPLIFVPQMSNYSLNTRIQTVLGIELWIKYKLAKLPHSAKQKIILYNNLKTKWDVILKKMCADKNVEINKNEMTDKEKENWIDFEDLRSAVINKVWKELSLEDEEGSIVTTYLKWRDLTLLSFFTLMPPTRIGNYEKMKIRYKKISDVKSYKTDKNYLMINSDAKAPHKYTLCFNQYKTSKFVGQITEPIKDETMIKLLDRYIKIREVLLPIQKRDLSNTDSLLINSDSNSMSQSMITETLKKTSFKVVGKKLSCDMFRKIFLTWFLADDSKCIEDRQQMAKFIGQTYNPTIMEKYRKIKHKLPPQKYVLNFD